LDRGFLAGAAMLKEAKNEEKRKSFRRKDVKSCDHSGNCA